MTGPSLVLTFANLTAALLGERALREAGFEPRLVPVPPGIASDCGFCALLPGLGGVELPAALERAYAACRDVAGAWEEKSQEAADGRGKEKRYARIT